MKHDPYAAFRYKPYRWLFSTNVLMITGYQMKLAALSWLIYEVTGSAWLLGLSGLFQFLPILALSIPIGHFADQHSRTTILRIGLTLHFIASAMIAFVAFIGTPITPLFIALLVVGVGSAFVSIARPSLLRDTLPAHVVENAVSWNSSGHRIATIVGPLLAGLLIELTGGIVLPMIINNILILLAMGCSMLIPSPRRAATKAPMTWKTVGEGLRFIKRTPLVMGVTLLDMFAVLLGGAEILLPIFAKDILQVGPTALGLMIAAPSIGSLLMALFLAHRPPFKRAGFALLWSVAFFGFSFVLFGLSTNIYLSLIALALTGAFDAVSVTIRATILHLFVPDEVRGRVFAVNMIFVYSSNELGDFESGAVAALIGTVPSVIVGGFASALVAVAFAWIFPDMRKLKKMTPEDPEVLLATPA